MIGAGDQTIHASGFDANLSPDAFMRWARHYYKCRHDFRSPDAFSPVPYFLLCRSIELVLKSLHLRVVSQDSVKRDFGHHLVKSLDALNSTPTLLSTDERAVLSAADAIYASKGFEYFNPEHALSGFKHYPDLQALDAIAAKLLAGGI